MTEAKTYIAPSLLQPDNHADLGPIEDYPAETTRSAVNLVIAGHLSRYSSTTIILSHGGRFYLMPQRGSRS